MDHAVVRRGQSDFDPVEASQQPRPLGAVLPSHLAREREVEHLPELRPLVREEVAEWQAAAARKERQQEPEEDDHPVRLKQRRRGVRVLCESSDNGLRQASVSDGGFRLVSGVQRCASWTVVLVAAAVCLFCLSASVCLPLSVCL